MVIGARQQGLYIISFSLQSLVIQWGQFGLANCYVWVFQVHNFAGQNVIRVFGTGMHLI